MRSFESQTSKKILKKKNIQNIDNKNITLKTKLLNLKISHKIIDYFNLSLFCLIIIYSFIAFNSQKEWTELYSALIKTRLINNELNGYISKTEEYFLNEVEIKDEFKKATSKDLIYLKKIIKKENNKFSISNFVAGLRDGHYQRGY